MRAGQTGVQDHRPGLALDVAVVRGMERPSTGAAPVRSSAPNLRSCSRSAYQHNGIPMAMEMASPWGVMAPYGALPASRFRLHLPTAPAGDRAPSPARQPRCSSFPSPNKVTLLFQCCLCPPVVLRWSCCPLELPLSSYCNDDARDMLLLVYPLPGQGVCGVVVEPKAV